MKATGSSARNILKKYFAAVLLFSSLAAAFPALSPAATLEEIKARGVFR